MHARVITLHAREGKTNEVVRIIREVVVPDAARQPVKVYQMVDRRDLAALNMGGATRIFREEVARLERYSAVSGPSPVRLACAPRSCSRHRRRANACRASSGLAHRTPSATSPVGPGS